MMKLPILNAGLGTMGRGRWKVEGGSDLSAYRLPPSIKRSAGLTLIEMIGVMAILSILATMMVPNIIEKIQEGQRDLEDNKLEEIAGALVKGIKAQGKLPDLTLHPTNTNGGWVAMAAPFAALGTNAIWKVYPGGAPGVTNSTARRVYFSTYLTNLLATTNTNFGFGWSTNLSGYRALSGAALMFIVSSSKPDLQLSCPTNANIGTNEQLWLQNWIKAYNNRGNIPATNQNIVGTVEGTTTRWTNRGQFLHVKVIDLAPLISNIQVEDWHGAIPEDPPPADASLLDFAEPLSNGNFPALSAPPAPPVPINIYDPLTPTVVLSTIFLNYNNTTPIPLNWQTTINIHPSTYSAKLDLRIFEDPVTGNKTDASRRIDGVNAWRRCQLNLELSPFGITEKFLVDAPAGPFFSIGNGSTNRVTRFGNPNAGPGSLPDETIRYDRHNFYALYGTPIKLFSSQESDFPQNTPSLQKTFVASQPFHQLVFSNGIWIEK